MPEGGPPQPADGERTAGRGPRGARLVRRGGEAAEGAALPAEVRMRLAAQRATGAAVHINDLFIPVGRHQVRFDWRHRAAIPFLLLVLVLSPLLLTWVAVYWVIEHVDRILRRIAAARPPGSQGP